MNTSNLYNEYKTALQKIADIKYASAVLQWDQETYIPPKGGQIRGRQIATLTETAHEQFTSQSFGELLKRLLDAGGLSEKEKRNVQLSWYDYQKAKKLPASFVRQLSEAVNKSFYAWLQARKENSFSIFEEPLHQIVEFKKQEAHLLGFQHHPYDALMNDYDHGLNTTVTDALFASLKPGLHSLLQKIKHAPQVDDRFLHQHFDKDKQWELGLEVLRRMHFDFEAGRQDISEHPFTTNFSSKDVRITTRIDENDFANMLWSCIHEGGHALYEQGLPADEYGLPLGEYCSLSIHESQSRLWENAVGRGLPFWQHNFPMLQQRFLKQFGAISLERFYRAINKVSPSLIRTEADELTYHFHVMIRYEIEKKLIEGSIRTSDIPQLWNALYKNDLGVDVPDDKQGCLQDVHWSHGSFGYFATYSIGSLYAAQLYATIRAQNESLEKELATGNNRPVHNWLQQHIYPFGRYYTSNELCKQATGEPLNGKYFIEHMNRKYSAIYEI